MSNLLSNVRKLTVITLAIPFLLWGMVFTVSLANAAQQPKYFVCKYVGTPGLNERLQTGNNPISVSGNALTPPIQIGGYFNDAQGRSYVVAEDTGQADPTCPTPQNNPCQYDATILATDPKCVKPQDPVTPTPTKDPVPDPVVPTSDGGMKDTVTGEVFYGK